MEDLQSVAPPPSPNPRLTLFAKDLYTPDLPSSAFTNSDFIKSELKPIVHEIAAASRPFTGLRKDPLLKINTEETGFDVSLFTPLVSPDTDLPM